MRVDGDAVACRAAPAVAVANLVSHPSPGVDAGESVGGRAVAFIAY